MVGVLGRRFSSVVERQSGTIIPCVSIVPNMVWCGDKSAVPSLALGLGLSPG